MEALSAISTLPANDREMELYISMVKKEILASKDKHLKRHLFYARKTMERIFLDREIVTHLKSL